VSIHVAKAVEIVRIVVQPKLYKRVAAAICALLVVLIATNAALAQSPADYFPTVEWRRSKPNRQGLNKKILKSLVNRLRRNQIRDLNSLLIVRNGYLVVEEYFNGSGPEDVHTLQSDSKSVTSLLIGIALQQGRIRTVTCGGCCRSMDWGARRGRMVTSIPRPVHATSGYSRYLNTTWL
jgi:hypothetical protein